MKKLLRLALLLGILWTILWVTRDRLLPAPPPPAAHPPPFRHPEPAQATTAPAPVEATDEPDDLSAIKGIGPVYKTRLAEMGITTFSGLLGADSEAVAETLDVGVASVVDWKTQATEHLG
jgi:predicted flap endonuclease-1-like 5' DNA nuclease